MKPARLAVLGIALAAGSGAAFLMSGGDPAPPPTPMKVEAPPVPMTDVLVAATEAAELEKAFATDIIAQIAPELRRALLIGAGAVALVRGRRPRRGSRWACRRGIGRSRGTPSSRRR